MSEVLGDFSGFRWSKKHRISQVVVIGVPIRQWCLYFAETFSCESFWTCWVSKWCRRLVLACVATCDEPSTVTRDVVEISSSHLCTKTKAEACSMNYGFKFAFLLRFQAFCFTSVSLTKCSTTCIHGR